MTIKIEEEMEEIEKLKSMTHKQPAKMKKAITQH